jgi:hypothetical protein
MARRRSQPAKNNHPRELAFPYRSANCFLEVFRFCVCRIVAFRGARLLRRSQRIDVRLQSAPCVPCANSSISRSVSGPEIFCSFELQLIMRPVLRSDLRMNIGRGQEKMRQDLRDHVRDPSNGEFI